MSGEVMSNLGLDAALDELGMLSTITNSRQEYLAEQLSRLAGLDILQDHNVDSKNDSGGMRTRASSMSTVNGRKFVLKKRRLRMPYDLRRFRLDRSSRFRTRSENESDMLEHSPHSSSNQQINVSPVPDIALPIDAMLSSNLFKSRSMESIDARASDESVSLPDKEVTDTIASSREVDSVSSGLHRLNVSE